MKSIYHGTAGANAKLRGKKTCVLSCQCCVLMNIKESERDKEADRDIQEFINKFHCGRDHTNDRPVNEKEVLEYNAKSIAEHIDNAVIEQVMNAAIYR